MSLSKLIRRKSGGDKVATATPATFATQGGGSGRTVASVATVAVANPPEANSASPWWLIHYADREPMEVACSPPATHVEILERHPDAIAAEPHQPQIDPPPVAALPTEAPDDRITCDECRNLHMMGNCLAARRRELVAASGYTPIRGMKRRCEAFAPRPEAADQRNGRERWPGLAE